MWLTNYKHSDIFNYAQRRFTTEIDHYPSKKKSSIQQQNAHAHECSSTPVNVPEKCSNYVTVVIVIVIIIIVIISAVIIMIMIKILSITNSRSWLVLCAPICQVIGARLRGRPKTGIQFQLCNWIPRDPHVNHARFNGFLIDFSTILRTCRARKRYSLFRSKEVLQRRFQFRNLL